MELFRQLGHQVVMVDQLEELFQVDVDHDVMVMFDVVMDLLNRLPGAPARSKAEA